MCFWIQNEIQLLGWNQSKARSFHFRHCLRFWLDTKRYGSITRRRAISEMTFHRMVAFLPHSPTDQIRWKRAGRSFYCLLCGHFRFGSFWRALSARTCRVAKWPSFSPTFTLLRQRIVQFYNHQKHFLWILYKNHQNKIHYAKVKFIIQVINV